MAGRFGQADVARDHRIEYQSAKARANVIRYLIGQAVAAIKHGQGHANDAQVRIEALLHALNGLKQLRQTFQGKEFALQGHQ